MRPMHQRWNLGLASGRVGPRSDPGSSYWVGPSYRVGLGLDLVRVIGFEPRKWVKRFRLNNGLGSDSWVEWPNGLGWVSGLVIWIRFLVHGSDQPGYVRGSSDPTKEKVVILAGKLSSFDRA